MGGQYFDTISSVDGQVFTQVARSQAEDVAPALDAVHAAEAAWGQPQSQNTAHCC